MDRQENIMHLNLPAQKEQLDTLVQWMETELNRCGVLPNNILKADIVAEEIFINICHYAYAPASGEADIFLEAQEDSVFVTFVDRGTAFNPLQASKPNTALSLRERQEGGLGIHMISNLVSKVEYEYKDGQNRLSITIEK